MSAQNKEVFKLVTNAYKDSLNPDHHLHMVKLGKNYSLSLTFRSETRTIRKRETLPTGDIVEARKLRDKVIKAAIERYGEAPHGVSESTRYRRRAKEVNHG